MIPKVLHILFFLSISMASLSGQESVEEVVIDTIVSEDVKLIELSFDLVSPTGIFGDNIDRTIQGLSFRYLNQTNSKSYSMLGVQVNYAHIGSLNATIQDFIDFNSETRSNFVSLELIYRYYLPYYNKAIEPFVEFGLGPQIFYTGTSTTLFDDQGSSDFFFESSDLGVVAHVDIGTTVKLWNNLFAILKASYNNGVAVTYDVPMETVVTEFPIDSFNQLTSQTNHFRFHFGLALSI